MGRAPMKEFGVTAFANFAAVPGRETACRNRPFVHLPRLRPDRQESRTWIGGLKGPFIGESGRLGFNHHLQEALQPLPFAEWFDQHVEQIGAQCQPSGGVVEAAVFFCRP